jgi:asparagine synthase (glutamine-hydrolysing)
MRNQLLRDADWAGMAHSIEIRVPFVDSVLMESLSPALASAHPPGKRDMAKAAPRPLPAEILARPRTGFVVPVRDWLSDKSGGAGVDERGLRGWARQVHAAAA